MSSRRVRTPVPFAVYADPFDDSVDGLIRRFSRLARRDPKKAKELLDFAREPEHRFLTSVRNRLWSEALTAFIGCAGGEVFLEENPYLSSVSTLVRSASQSVSAAIFSRPGLWLNDHDGRLFHLVNITEKARSGVKVTILFFVESAAEFAALKPLIEEEFEAGAVVRVGSREEIRSLPGFERFEDLFVVDPSEQSTDHHNAGCALRVILGSERDPAEMIRIVTWDRRVREVVRKINYLNEHCQDFEKAKEVWA